MTRKKASAEAALNALADPTRRQLIERLKSGPRAVGDLARGVPVSRPAVSQHLAVLKAAGLVRDVADGTRRAYEIDPKGLGAVRAWLDDMWATRWRQPGGLGGLGRCPVPPVSDCALAPTSSP